MRLYLFSILTFTNIVCFAQPVISVATPGQSGGNYGSVMYYDNSALLSKPKTSSLSYDDISGSPFWEPDWNAAILFMPNNKAVKVQRAKLNLYTGEIHFINTQNVEMIAEKKEVIKAVFFKGADTTKISAVFELQMDISRSATSDYCYYKVLNSGETRLLELRKAFIKDKEYDPLSGKSDKSFYTKVSYALQNNTNISYLSSLNQSNVLAVINSSQDIEDWLKQHKNKLKNEAEIISFLNYYNSKSKK